MKSCPLELVRVEVTEEDIEEMYDRYDSGMADHTTANALSLALQKLLKPDAIPKIVSTREHHARQLDIDDEWFPLSKEIQKWLEKTSKGVRVSPAVFSIILPKKCLRVSESENDDDERAMAA